VAKFSILGSLEGDNIADAVPPAYRTLVRSLVVAGTPYTVILFPHNRTHSGVSTSALVRRALSRIDATGKVLAVGGDFTREATAILEEQGAIVARIADFGWTDEDYIGMRHPTQ
jgi:hypothetical protein